MIQEWVLRNHKKLKLVIEEFQWPKEINISINDIQVNIEFDGIKATGRSVDENESSALLKAIAESIERWVLQKYNLPSSNGIAAHTNLVEAQISARNELLERDNFLCHYLTRTPWSHANKKILELNPIYKIAQINNFQIEIGWIKSFLDQYVVISLAKNITQKNNSNVQGIYLGLACTNTLEASILKSFNELTMTLGHALTNGKSNPISLEQFNNLSEWGPEVHGKLALHKNNQNQFINSFHFSNDFNNHQDSILQSNKQINFEYKQFDIPEVFNPFIVVQAINPNLQNLFFGPTEFCKLNMNRLNDFKKIEISNLNFFPHPLA